MKKPIKPIFIICIAVVVILMIFLFLIPGATLIKGFISSRSPVSEQSTQTDTSTEQTKDAGKSDITADVSTTETTITSDKKTPVKETITHQKTTQAQTSSGSDILIAEAHYVISGTPGGKGATMMSLATDNSESKGTINEGTIVRVLSDDKTNTTGYVQVLVFTNPMDIHCFIKKEYLEFKEYPPYYSPPSSDTRYVSYNTPAHAGINMREQPSSSSELVVTMAEGTPVFIAEPYSPDNHGYVKVGCDEYPSGEPLYGWVLYNYLVS